MRIIDWSSDVCSSDLGAPPDSGGFPPERSWAKTGCSHMVESPPSRASRSTFRKTRIQEHEMGKGDRKTAKGKRYNSSYGNARTHVATKATGAASAPVAKKAATRKTRAPAKKAVDKKTRAKK